MLPDEAQQIEAAIAAHMQWLARLRTAIAQRTSEFTPGVVRLDNQCALGRWLYKGLPGAPRGSPVFEELRSVHAQFHEQAATILQLAVTGKASEVPTQFIQLRRHRIVLNAELARRLINQVDRLVRQEPIGDIPIGQLDGLHDRILCNLNSMVFFIPVAKPLNNADSFIHVRWLNVNRLKPPLQCPIFFDMLAVLI